ncbi:Helitron helicase [Phytophthora megakarya]|uniref:ATP-dependent DNA helicase n=1 Tax=Phytophthora megakarya TaxID=4795 RepID=A0A225WSC8_9STRA|nr:Helitron helicase [Phytophthora megakarya]
MPYALQQLFSTILVYSLPDHASALWDRFKKDFSADYYKSIAKRDRQNSIERDEEVRLRMAEYKCLKWVADCLLSNGKTLDTYGLPELSTYQDVSEEVEREDTGPRDVVANEIATYEPEDLARTTALADQMNENQKEVFDQVIEAVNHPVDGQKLFFVDGPGGTGKSFVLEQMLDHVRLQKKVAIAVTSSEIAATERNVNALIDAVYPGVGDDNLQDEYFVDRAILAPTDASVRRINEMVAERLTGDTKEYLSVERLERVADPNMFEQEFLKSLNFSGIPPDRIVLKVETPIIMIRNLNSDVGMCNGTRLRVVSLREGSIEATIMSGPFKGKTVFIPRIIFYSEDDDKEFPFKLLRKPFPVVPAFGTPINKAQGQSIHHAIKIAVDPSAIDETGNIHTKNIVYREIFDL